MPNKKDTKIAVPDIVAYTAVPDEKGFYLGISETVLFRPKYQKEVYLGYYEVHVRSKLVPDYYCDIRDGIFRGATYIDDTIEFTPDQVMTWCSVEGVL